MKGSSSKNLKFTFRNLDYYIDDCGYLTIDEIEQQTRGEASIYYQPLKSAFEFLEEGEIWQFRNIRKFRKSVVVKTSDGFFVINSGHISARPSEPASRFFRSKVGEDKYIKNFEYLVGLKDSIHELPREEIRKNLKLEKFD